MQQDILVFYCSNCGVKLQTTAYHAGQSWPCPKCGTVISAPNIVTKALPMMPVHASSKKEETAQTADKSQQSLNFAQQAQTSEKTVALTSKRIFPDNSLSFRDMEQKNDQNIFRMIYLSIAALLAILIVFWLFNSAE